MIAVRAGIREKGETMKGKELESEWFRLVMSEVVKGLGPFVEQEYGFDRLEQDQDNRLARFRASPHERTLRFRDWDALRLLGLMAFNWNTLENSALRQEHRSLIFELWGLWEQAQHRQFTYPLPPDYGYRVLDTALRLLYAVEAKAPMRELAETRAEVVPMLDATKMRGEGLDAMWFRLVMSEVAKGLGPFVERESGFDGPEQDQDNRLAGFRVMSDRPRFRDWDAQSLLSLMFVKWNDMFVNRSSLELKDRSLVTTLIQLRKAEANPAGWSTGDSWPYGFSYPLPAGDGYYVVDTAYRLLDIIKAEEPAAKLARMRAEIVPMLREELSNPSRYWWGGAFTSAPSSEPSPSPAPSPDRQLVETMDFHPEERIGLLIDEANLYFAARALGFNIDYKSLRELFAGQGRLIRASYYTVLRPDPDDPKHIVNMPLINWLNRNGYNVVVFRKSTNIGEQETEESAVPQGVGIEIAVDAMSMADRIDHFVLFSGDIGFRRLVKEIQRKGIRVTVVSTVRSSPPMIARELTRQADVFIDLQELAPKIVRAWHPDPETAEVD